MDYWLIFLTVMAASFLLPEIARKFHLPYVTALMITGMIIGPNGIGIIDGEIVNESLDFVGEIGAVFLMFTAGLGLMLSSIKRIQTKIYTLSILNGTIPFIVGYLVVWWLGYDFYSSLLIGVVFISSSVGVIIPTLKEAGLLTKKVGQAVLSAVVFEDITSLLLLTFILQSISPKTWLPLPVFIMLTILVVYLMIRVLPRLENIYLKFASKGRDDEDMFERELRFVFVILILVSIIFEAFGFHAIIAAFFLGLILSDIIKHRQVFHKIHTLGYGIFIPIFFLVIGMRTNLSIISDSWPHLSITILIVASLILSKILSGIMAGFLTNHSYTESVVIGVSTIPQLSTTIVAAYAAFNNKIIDEVLLTSIIVLSIVTSFLAPLMVSWSSKHHLKTYHKGFRLYDRQEFLDEIWD